MAKSKWQAVQEGGGPAFSGSGDPYHEPGMSLLDYFAGQALNGILGSSKKIPEGRNIAEDCYQWAKAMIAEKRRRESETK